MKVVVVQKGAREHYAVARALHQRNLLTGLVTDWYAFGKTIKGGSQNTKADTPGISRPLAPRWLPAAARSVSFIIRNPSAQAARTDDLPEALIRSFPMRSLWWKWRERRLKSQGQLYEAYAQTDAAFAFATAQLKLPGHDVLFAYAYAGLELLAAEKQCGTFTVLNQIDPGPAHVRIVAEEMNRHPELAGPPPQFPEAYFNRLRQEWGLADVIVTNSEWTSEAIVAEGADSKKIEVLPLAFEKDADGLELDSQNQHTGKRHSAKSNSSDGKLRVLWLGQVAPAKGIYYLVEAARILQGEKVEFLVVGSSQIRREFVAAAPDNIRWLGPVARSETRRYYKQSELFVLPTLSDGFALTQLEALAHGLPVVTTPNCGRVVESGKTGFIVPPRDPQALAEAIMKFVRDRDMAATMRSSCLEAVNQFSLDAVGAKLVSIIEKHSNLRCKS